MDLRLKCLMLNTITNLS
jgi:flagellar biosynthesis component FlhA